MSRGVNAVPSNPLVLVVTGPESTGKTTLALLLASRLAAPLVPEEARAYLDQHRADYSPGDLLAIAHHQQRAEAEAYRSARLHGSQHLVADTDLQVIYVWWQEKYGAAPQTLGRAYARQSERLYLLCYPDLPWQPDPQREHPHDRLRLFRLYERDLISRQARYVTIRGAGDERLEAALDAIDNPAQSAEQPPET